MPLCRLSQPPDGLEFRIRTGLKDIIGRELITDERIAIFELVKNSYDANAHLVTIKFENVTLPSRKDSARIWVIDNGDGMSYDDIVKKWLFVGYSEKKIPRAAADSDFREKIAKRKRIFAGAKGIGRFSADRLGEKLGLYTKVEKEQIVHFVDVDWNKFEIDQNEEFQTIPVTYNTVEEMPPEKELKGFKRGTAIQISSLNDKWDREKLVKLKRYLQRLINPSQSLEKDEFRINLVAEEFITTDRGKEDHERVNGEIQNRVFEELDRRTTKIQSEVSEEKITTTLTDKGRGVFTLEEKNPYDSLKDVRLTVYYLNTEAKSQFTRIMGLEPKNYGSIFLYKNGFRIHPYGNENDDWLGLDRRKTQGYARFLGNREVIGRIEVYGVQSGFQEVSSRAGGVVESEAYRQLQGLNGLFIDKVLKRLEQYVVGAINWDTEDEERKRTPGQVKEASFNVIERVVGSTKDSNATIVVNKDLFSILKEREVEKVPELIHNVEHITKFVKSTSERRYIRSQLKAMRLATRTLEREKREKEEELEVKTRESLFFQKTLSTDKEISQNLIHNIGVTSTLVEKLLRRINQKIREGEPISSVVPLIDRISVENNKIKVLADIVSLANFDLKVKEITDDIVAYMRQYLKESSEVRSDEMRIHSENGETVYKTTFVPLETAIVLDNLVSNSGKAGANIMTFRFDVRGSKLHVFVGDNGKGVPRNEERFLFTRGFTTTNGSGIGLHQIRTLVESKNGSIEFIGNNHAGLGKGACFEIILV
jgi:signal transduction histidine kinase